MPAQITNYQCPNCTGPIHFDTDSGGVDCDYCGAHFDVKVIEQLYADKEQEVARGEALPEWDFSTAENWSEDEAATMRVYNCPSCSAQLICDETTAVTSCPYCDNPTVIPGQFAGGLRPDYVLPFKLDKNAAIAALKKYYKGKKFLPKSFVSENHIAEIKGVYVPFWLFDGTADASMRFHGTKESTFRRGNEEITTIDHYRVVREGSVTFEKVPADGSSKMPDAHMDSVEPFDYSELKDFSTAYMPGFLADKYDMDSQSCAERANNRIKNSTESTMRSTTAGYTTLKAEHTDIYLNQGSVHYALMPVWMLSTRWKGENFLFAMNGQTGKLIGDLPVDKGKFAAWFAGISLPLMAILALLLFYGGGII